MISCSIFGLNWTIKELRLLAVITRKQQTIHEVLQMKAEANIDYVAK